MLYKMTLYNDLAKRILRVNRSKYHHNLKAVFISKPVHNIGRNFGSLKTFIQ